MKKKYLVGENEYEIVISYQDDEKLSFDFNGVAYEVEKHYSSAHDLSIKINQKNVHVSHYKDAEGIVQLSLPTKTIGAQEVLSTTKRKKSTDSDQKITAPMTGKVFKLFVSEGSAVKKGEALITLEAMKMEHVLKSPKDAIVQKVHYKVGELVQGGVELIELDDESEGLE